MKQKLTLALIAVIALIAGAWSYSSAAPAQQQWEYQFVTECNQARANGLGGVGWELVTMDASSSHRECVFKRPRP
jgi:hypothetical protein